LKKEVLKLSMCPPSFEFDPLFGTAGKGDEKGKGGAILERGEKKGGGEFSSVGFFLFLFRVQSLVPKWGRGAEGRKKKR